MSSSCLSGRSYGIDLEIIKSPSSSSSNFTRSSSSCHNTPSPCSTLSESSAISTRKPRTPRKRPKQTYNEAATLLSTVYPNIFSTKHLSNTKFPKLHNSNSFFDESSSQLLLSFPVMGNDNSCFLLHQPIQEKPPFQLEPKLVSNFQYKQQPCCSNGNGNGEVEFNDEEEDLDAESILDEEIIDEGIDSIMGNLNVDEIQNNNYYNNNNNNWYGVGNGIPMGMGLGLGLRSALRGMDEGNWWCYPTVDMLQISPKLEGDGDGNRNGKKKVVTSWEKKKKEKKKKIEKGKGKAKADAEVEPSNKKEESGSGSGSGSGGLVLKLKIKYDDVLKCWSYSQGGSPFLDESLSSASDGQGNDVSLSARLAQIDLFSDTGLREASVMRYKEKRRTRLFSKKIRYQVRKLNADQRPRMKGRFVRRPGTNGQQEKGKKKVM